MLDRSRLPARLQHELKMPLSDPIHSVIKSVLWFLGGLLFILGGISLLAIVDRPGIGRSKRASLDIKTGAPGRRCVAVKPRAVIAWGYLLENGEIVPFDEALPTAGGLFLRCTRRQRFGPTRIT